MKCAATYGPAKSSTLVTLPLCRARHVARSSVPHDWTSIGSSNPRLSPPLSKGLKLPGTVPETDRSSTKATFPFGYAAHPKKKYTACVHPQRRSSSLTSVQARSLPVLRMSCHGSSCFGWPVLWTIGSDAASCRAPSRLVSYVDWRVLGVRAPSMSERSSLSKRCTGNFLTPSRT